MAWSLTSQATAWATLVSATCRTYSSAPMNPAMIRANTMMKINSTETGSRRNRRFFFAGPLSAFGAVASRSVGPAGGVGGGG